MPEWYWVVVGYGTAYGAIAGYLIRCRLRAAELRRRIERPR